MKSFVDVRGMTRHSFGQRGPQHEKVAIHLPNSDFIRSRSQHGVLVPANLFRMGVNVKF